MRFFRFAMLCAAAAVLCFPIYSVSAEGPLTSGSWLSGTLKLIRTHHPNGQTIEAYQIVSEPRQMQASDDFCTNPDGKASTFHLFTKTKSDRVHLSRLVGKKMQIRVWELFCSQTAWHVGDAAVSKWSWQ
ncbi:MAG: hypothetical protein HY242_11775 [Afipia sp.]|nr:hypothetical protein [Afipia sp.]